MHPVAFSPPGDHHLHLPTMIVQDQDRSLIHAMIEKMERNPQHDYPIDSLAMDAGMSVRRFTDTFKFVTGNAVHQQLTKIRMEKAKELLRDTDLPISAIAKKVGYHDKSAFIRKFKIYAGPTPLAYRRANKG